MKDEPQNQPAGADPLDALLRDADEYVPDHGFTARVVQNLPLRRNRRWRRFAVLATALLLGLALAAWQVPAIVTIFDGALQPSSLLHWQTVLGFVPLLAALASLAWVLFAAVNEDD